MMHLNFGSYMPESMTPSYAFDDSEEACHTQMTLSQVTQRLTRGTTTRPRAESSSRVSKPNSASTSPGLSKMARRRTMASDSLSTRRHEQAMKYMAATLGLGEEQFHAHGGQQQQQQQQQYHHHHQTRPVSWHPSTQIPSTHYQQQPASFPAPPTYYQQPDFYSPASHYSPEMTSTFSSNPSPTSSFSTLPVPYGCVENLAAMSTDGWHYGERSSLYSPMDDSLYAGEPCATFNGLMESPSGLDWNGFSMQGYNTTSPPTPDTFLTAMATTQLPQPAITEAYYQAADDEPEDDGEILVGMGLYDDKREEDPQLNNYRYTVSSLLGTNFRPQEPRGKGLKLEETWEPPKSDDEEEEEDDEDDESED